MKTEQVKITQIRTNAANPRSITGDKFNRLVDSILVFPKMLELRPIVVDSTMTALGGNQRRAALLAISKMTPEQLAQRLAALDDFRKKTEGKRQTGASVSQTSARILTFCIATIGDALPGTTPTVRSGAPSSWICLWQTTCAGYGIIRRPGRVRTRFSRARSFQAARTLTGISSITITEQCSELWERETETMQPR